LDGGNKWSIWTYFVKCVSALNLEFGCRVGINPGRVRMISNLWENDESGTRNYQAISFTGFPSIFAL
jgi:hypothetical protein